MTLVEVSMRVMVNPTECKEKVVTALKNVFGDIALEGSNRRGFTVLEAKFVDLGSLSRFRIYSEG